MILSKPPRSINTSHRRPHPPGRSLPSTGVGGGSSVYAADKDGDEDVDVPSAAAAHDRIIWQQNLDRAVNFGPPQFIDTGVDGAKSVFAADIDRGGDIDVLCSSRFEAVPNSQKRSTDNCRSCIPRGPR